MKKGSLASALFIITGVTIGAGIFGLPRMVAVFGIVPSLVVLAILGAVMMFFNTLVAELVSATRTPLQLPGLAGRYAGSLFKDILALTQVGSLYGSLVAYIVGAGDTIQGLVPQVPVAWIKLVFGCVLALPVWAGLKCVVVVERKIGRVLIGSLIVCALIVATRISPDALVERPPAWGSLVQTIAVMVFALHGAPGIPVAEKPAGDRRRLKKAVMLGTLIPVGVYAIFSAAFAGALGTATPDIATAGLYALFGEPWGTLGRIITVLAFTGAFVGIATALKDLWQWDFGVPSRYASSLVLVPPLIVAVSGRLHFLDILAAVGGIIIACEMIVIIGTYWCAVYKKALRLHPRALAVRVVGSCAVVALALAVGVATVLIL